MLHLAIDRGRGVILFVYCNVNGLVPSERQPVDTYPPVTELMTQC